jgi:hypothetical protein
LILGLRKEGIDGHGLESGIVLDLVPKVQEEVVPKVLKNHLELAKNLGENRVGIAIEKVGLQAEIGIVREGIVYLDHLVKVLKEHDLQVGTGIENVDLVYLDHQVLEEQVLIAIPREKSLVVLLDVNKLFISV